ncbi:Zinc/iron permease [Kockovaella imperatae]|uniref:Zinc/iron permease n=1 Tax=Kockovaella imperatae TaxID=4999 RepID=A0A1Y1UL08_9TREE|nr:Zinc/iron permease [Kockovaella imperatae]ORX38743.1 Zinc/iron permease [Kockovaella imperatae]
MSAPNFGLADPTHVDLTTASQHDVLCYLFYTPNDYKGYLGARVSSIFVILVVSSFVTFFPVAAARVPKLKIPIYVYLFARYFGSGVIVATGFVHLLDPAYYEIGTFTCVGSAPGWIQYSWPPAFAMFAGVVTFLLDFAADRYVEKKYGITFMGSHSVTTQANCDAGGVDLHTISRRPSMEEKQVAPREEPDLEAVDRLGKDRLDDLGFKQQITAFLVLEFGVIFHSVIIGLTLGSAGNEFVILYVVIIFHQSFEGMGIGARLSGIPFPRKYHWMPWALCAAYGLTTPISIAIGLAVRTTFNPNGYTANIVQGVLDALSGGILIYTGFVELLARDFLFNPDRVKDDRKLAFMVVCVCAGAGLMAFLGKWI